MSYEAHYFNQEEYDAFLREHQHELNARSTPKSPRSTGLTFRQLWDGIAHSTRFYPVPEPKPPKKRGPHFQDRIQEAHERYYVLELREMEEYRDLIEGWDHSTEGERKQKFRSLTSSVRKRQDANILGAKAKYEASRKRVKPGKPQATEVFK
jgi:hypothetical protein